MTRWERIVVTLALVAGTLALTLAAQASSRRLLNRSLYLPVAFELCEHLGKATLYQDDVAVAVLPAERIFQFTYYPELDRLAPELVRIRIEGVYLEDSQPFVAKLAVTAAGIYSGRRRIDVGFEKAVERLSFRIDTRAERKRLLLQCPRFCARAKPDEPRRAEASTER